MKRPAVKAIVSTLLLLCFLFLALGGALLYFGKTGLVLGVPRYILRETHAVCALGFCLIAALHFILNLRVFGGEMRSLTGRGKKRRSDEKE